jgi:SAM-dependent methyltransferase
VATPKGGGARRKRRSPSPAWFAKNRDSWDERVPIHVASDFYDVEGFKAGRSALRPYEFDDVGSVRGKDLVHLQCHFGIDTLSWAKRGARVVGVDFSAPAIEAARRLAGEMGLAAQFVVANVYDAPTVLRRRFDVVYTGRGALCWLPDIQRWAAVVARLLRPGGLFYLTEFHPVVWLFADDSRELKFDYFTPATGFVEIQSGSYAERTATTTHDETVQWNHNIGAVVTALIEAGLEIRLIRENDVSDHRRWPFLVPAGDGRWRVPDGTPVVPLMYMIRAVKPRNRR